MFFCSTFHVEAYRTRARAAWNNIGADVSRSRFTRKRAVQLGAIMAAGCLVLSACGGNSDSGSSSSGNDTGSADSSGPALTGDPIKIGYVASMSGPQATNGLGAKAVAHAWQEYTNSHGGVLGHPVDITMVDSKNTVPGATAAAQG